MRAVVTVGGREARGSEGSLAVPPGWTLQAQGGWWGSQPGLRPRKGQAA